MRFDELMVGGVHELCHVCIALGTSWLVEFMKWNDAQWELTDRVSCHSDSRVTRVCSDVEENMMLPK